MTHARVHPAFIGLFLFFLAMPVASGSATDKPAIAAERLTPKQVAESVRATMDTTVDPCQDFYLYACGGWLKTTQLPPDRPRWGRGFSEIDERNLAVLREILEEARKESGPDAARARIGDFFGACMDEAVVEKLGAAPMKPLLQEIGDVKDAGSLMAMAGKLHALGMGAVFQLVVAPDFKDPNIDIAHFFQGGLGLPDRDYYLKEDDQSKELRNAYEGHVARMLALLGESQEESAGHAGRILAFESELAKVSMPRDEARNLEKIYHKIDIAGLKSLTPGLPWERYLAATGYPGIVHINAAVPDFFKGVEKLAGETQPETLQAYLRWQLVHNAAPVLSKAFVDENFAFFGAMLSGQKEIEPRWKRCVNATDAALGEALGQAFVDRTFAGDSKDKALVMIRGIEAAFESGLPRLAWMDDPTRQRAAGKMKAISNKIGYPDQWRDYSSMIVVPGDYFGNTMAAQRFEFRRNAGKIGKAVDRKEWGMTPPTVNAYYNPLVNEMVFPAGIMQRPFFHRDFPAPMNFGGIGMVMGHELTHGFDDQGRKFDGSGQMTEWWEPAVVQKFEEQAQCVDDLYDSYEVQPGLHLNGKLTLGENIADLGGIKEAYSAYREWVKQHGEPPAAVEGLSNDQLFFVGFAQTWCTLSSPEMERMMVTVDTHSASRFRVKGPLSNLPEFSQAFSCKEGTPMRPAKSCVVW